MTTVPEAFRRMPRWWHDAPGRDWLDALPSLLAAQCRRWGLEPDGEARHGSNALVLPVRRGGEPFVLRLSPPGDDVRAEARALRVWSGRGTVRLFAVDTGSRALLLERLSTDRSLTAEPLPEALEVIGRLVTTLAVPVPPQVRSTAAIAADHVETFERDWLALGGPTPRSQLDTALRLAAERAGTVTADRAVDGDLHCAQVLAADRAPWLVVDPVLLRGDREYDVGRVLWDRLDELPGSRDVVTALDLFVRAADVPPARARAWVVLRSMSYLLWGLDRGLTLDPPRCRRLLDIFC